MPPHRARKRFGQHFLIDEAVVDAIVRAIAPTPADTLVEIGPGLGALTMPLLRAVPWLMVVELDRDLAARLRARCDPARLRVVEADALEVDFAAFGTRLRVVGNLPYNISSPLLFHLLDCADRVVDQHFMLQREVVDRMVARPSTPNYGRLSVMLQARYGMEKLFDVAPASFDPPPRVTSSVVRMVPLPAPAVVTVRWAAFASVVARAFSQRRKMLRRGLGDWTAGLDWSGLAIAPTARAEELSVADFARLTDWLVVNAGLRIHPKNQ
ncbi:MAG: 16S rRNA (adenine(1518)-N(6)/adenine(1519)-N(6))-dimethyltransferase RsmA [Candidimonas sp.]|nr:MAG: 16S rRNA (adenine(1518)-N(6)/adenine(1519)-N(6))-dimethyltransferase RsmA [Candidimonas sp.]